MGARRFNWDESPSGGPCHAIDSLSGGGGWRRQDPAGHGDNVCLVRAAGLQEFASTLAHIQREAPRRPANGSGT